MNRGRAVVISLVTLIAGGVAAPVFGETAASLEPASLSPLPAPTVRVLRQTVMPPGVATAKPLPRLLAPPSPVLPPPLSGPQVGTPLAGTPVTSNVVAEVAKVAKVEAPAAPVRGPVAAAPSGVRYAATEINVRPRPDPGASRIDVVDEGTKLELVGPVVNGRWIKVRRRGRELGYVALELLLPQPPKPH